MKNETVDIPGMCLGADGVLRPLVEEPVAADPYRDGDVHIYGDIYCHVTADGNHIFYNRPQPHAQPDTDAA